LLKFLRIGLKKTVISLRNKDEYYMKAALEEAERAGLDGEVPVGAVLVHGGAMVSRDHNRCIQRNDPTAHAEILVLRSAGEALKNYRLNDAAIYVTVEPCPMCASAMVHARISRLVYGAAEPKFGAVESKFRFLDAPGLYHRIEVEGRVLEKECSEMLKTFFRDRRSEK
jgi:tRNA(adenine34) deaminase